MSKRISEALSWPFLALFLVFGAISSLLLELNHRQVLATLHSTVAIMDNLTQARLRIMEAYLSTERLAGGDPTSDPTRPVTELARAGDLIDDLREGRSSLLAISRSVPLRDGNLLTATEQYLASLSTLQGQLEDGALLGPVERRVAFAEVEENAGSLEQAIYARLRARLADEDRRHGFWSAGWGGFIVVTALGLLVVRRRGIRIEQDRKLAEEALIRSEARFRSLIEHAPDMIFVLAADSTVTYESPAVERTLGYERGELMGRDPFEFIHPDDLEIVNSTFEEVAAAPENVRSATYRYRHKNGEWRLMESTAMNLLSDPAVRGFVVNTRDVSERVRAEENARDRERQLAEAQEIANVGSWTFDVLGGEVTWSDQLYRMLGIDSSEEPSLERLLQRVPAEDQPAVREAGQRAETSGGNFSLEHRVLGEGDAVRVVQARFRAEFGPDHQPLRLFGTMQDITERRHAEEAVERSRDFYMSIFDRLPVLIWRSDASGKCDYLNSAWLEFTGRTLEEELGDGWIESIHPDDRERCVDTYRRYFQQREPFEMECRLRTASGEYRSVLNTGRPLKDLDGRFIGYIGGGFDIHEQRRTEQQLRQAQKLEAVGRLAGGIAHDFNNLLNIIGGTAHLLLMDLPDEESAYREEVEEIVRAVERAAGLTRQLLAFSRQQMLQPKLLDLNETVLGTERMLKRMLGEDIQFRTDLDPRLPSIKADPQQLEQILLNLAINARDAMPTGGTLITETRTFELEEDFAKSFPYDVVPGEYVMLSVTDTGEGMSDDVRQQIFEPFFTTKPSGKGTGLGLSTVYGIVKQSGGYIWVESELGKGTTFRIYLPRAKERTATAEVDRPEAAIAKGSGTILLVEDEQGVRRVARRVLERAGYNVLEAGDGVLALKVAHEHEGTIDLLLTDVVMPRMSGRELADEIVKCQPEILVLYTSGHTEEAMVRHRVFEGHAEFIQKPYAPQSLLTKVAAVLERR